MLVVELVEAHPMWSHWLPASFAGGHVTVILARDLWYEIIRWIGASLFKDVKVRSMMERLRRITLVIAAVHEVRIAMDFVHVWSQSDVRLRIHPIAWVPLSDV